MATEAKRGEGSLFIEEVCTVPGGEGVRLCLQCGACGGACPAADAMQHTPRELIALVQSGARVEALSSNAMRFCVSCYLCNETCPQGARPADIMLALEHLAARHGFAQPRLRTPSAHGGLSGANVRRGAVSIKERKLQSESARQLKAILDRARTQRDAP